MEISSVKPGKPPLAAHPPISLASIPALGVGSLAVGNLNSSQAGPGGIWVLGEQPPLTGTPSPASSVIDEILDALRLIGENAREHLLTYLTRTGDMPLRADERLGNPYTSNAPLAPAPAHTLESLREEVAKIDTKLSLSGVTAHLSGESNAARESTGPWVSSSHLQAQSQAQGEPGLRSLTGAGADPQRSIPLRGTSDHTPRPLFEERTRHKPPQSRSAKSLREALSSALRRAASWCESRLGRFLRRQDR